MRNRLRETHESNRRDDEIRLMRAQINRLIWMIENDSSKHFAASKALLPPPSTVPRGSRGYVLGAGPDTGMICEISPDGTQWHAINFFE